ncbi:MAG: SEC-C domain-containing protein [Gammaproteobacteria bacterium]|nr:SEC-C domain-containing protein [Gammaproteobacteria bacterium]
MDIESSEMPCPCGSGLVYGACCGKAERSQPHIVAAITTEGVVADEPLTAQLQEALEHIDASPALFPARVNFAEYQSYFIMMSPQTYRDSVFMDPGRIKGSCIIQTDLAWLRSACDKIAGQQTAFIFHTAFCGSTLMSQALDAAYHTLPIREPELLGNLLAYLRNPANSPQDKDAWYRRVMALLSRRFDAQQMAVVKANDYANPLMLAMIERHADAPLLFMHTPLQEFLAGCLKANNRKQWIAQRYAALRQPINQLLGLGPDFTVAEDAYGELAALYWSYNIALFHKAYRSMPARVRSLEFNHMLANPYTAVARCADWFGLMPIEGTTLEQAMAPLLGVYSKNSKFTYSPQQRDGEITALLSAHQAELAAAEELARKLLAADYPEDGLPGDLLGY